MYFGESILSKVIEENNYNALVKHRICEEDFSTDVEKEVFRYISNYAYENRNQMPSAETVMYEIDKFTMRYDVQDTYEYLAKQLKSDVTERRIRDFMITKGNSTFGEINVFDWTKLIQEGLEEIVQQADYRTEVGTSLTKDTKGYEEEFLKRKEGKSFKVWKSAFPSIPDYLTGNMYCWAGRPGRGKSTLTTMVEATSSAMQGATVLIWALEQSKFEILSRIYSHISAKQGLQSATIEGKKEFIGYEVNRLLKGDLTDNEEEFMDFLRNINRIIPGEIIIRAVDDEDFYHRGCKQLESDILQTKADVVIIDPIYLMDFEKNTSKTTGGDVANTSKKLRFLAGHSNVVLHVITQADEVKEESDDMGNREINVPERFEIKKTKAVIEDSTNVFLMDSADGKFKCKIGKGRNGGEGVIIDGIFMPSVGLVYEPSKSDLAKEVEQLGF
jgi:Replicative DNA helicase